MAVVLNALRKVYPGRPPRVALDDVTLTMDGTFGLLGPNGAGKTTLLRMVATVLRPTAGSITIEGVPATDRRSVRGMLGYLPQRFGFHPQLTAYETLSFMACLAMVSPGRADLMSLLERVGLAGMAGTRVTQLSGGMVQRLGIACALVGDPRVLIVDEPTVGLDHESRLEFRALLASRAAAGRTVLISTHVVGDAEAVCQRLAVLNHGRLAFVGTPAELAAAARERVWQVRVPLAHWDAFSAETRPLAAVREGGWVQARLVAAVPPPGMHAVPLQAVAEDGYAWVLGATGPEADAP
ncbi:MAG: ATP-binding cassette domain-containing protein [Bacillota bacterium]|nr:ATP-binding cassette domain-containing protein [Bacillota bacterium]